MFVLCTIYLVVSNSEKLKTSSDSETRTSGNMGEGEGDGVKLRYCFVIGPVSRYWSVIGPVSRYWSVIGSSKSKRRGLDLWVTSLTFDTSAAAVLLSVQSVLRLPPVSCGVLWNYDQIMSRKTIWLCLRLNKITRKLTYFGISNVHYIGKVK